MKKNLIIFVAHIDDFECSCYGYLFKHYPRFYFRVIRRWCQTALFNFELENSDLMFELKPASDRELYRLKTILTKEPETIEWINCFDNDRILFDVGANIGVISLYSLIKHPNVQVFAFEPEPENFIRLVDNLERTACERATAYLIGLSIQH